MIVPSSGMTNVGDATANTGLSSQPTMAAGDWHYVDGCSFQETEFGPCLPLDCVDCGGRCYGLEEYPNPRCEDCSIKYYGVVRPAERIKYRVRAPVAQNLRSRKQPGRYIKGRYVYLD